MSENHIGRGIDSSVISEVIGSATINLATTSAKKIALFQTLGLGVPVRQLSFPTDERDHESACTDGALGYHGHISVIPQYLAVHKAELLRREFPDRHILASDSAKLVVNQLLGKPKDLEDALRQIEIQSGRVVKQVAGTAFWNPLMKRWFYAVTKIPMQVREISKKDAETYVQANSEVVLASAGSMPCEHPDTFGLYDGNVYLATIQLYDFSGRLIWRYSEDFPRKGDLTPLVSAIFGFPKPLFKEMQARDIFPK